MMIAIREGGKPIGVSFFPSGLTARHRRGIFGRFLNRPPASGLPKVDLPEGTKDPTSLS
jgi:hypothetical protein